ncbi:MAG: DsrE/DsrF/DrsH-like family protein [Armatimonadota bacterium]|nr:DsrE/DsrF/DrsH-like family protein [Armatimonadota bacterium]MDR5702306.1 DsrE/DsrF/DrsH-like family protein [Armatimonadota bacterium]MDR7435889.1 DsrE/DsrF/DrsH-like family protein [Armatimonadota bacterium]
MADQVVVEQLGAVGEGKVKQKRRLALVASKGTLDMAYPPLILATTAAAMGWEVGIFFTFYGLDILHRHRLKNLRVSPVGNPAMPPPVRFLPVKVPDILGALPGMPSVATAIMKRWMRQSNMPTVEELLEIARESGVRLFACATTMGVMGIGQEDLVDGAECAGATTFLDFAAEADVTLFV